MSSSYWSSVLGQSSKAVEEVKISSVGSERARVVPHLPSVTHVVFYVFS